MANCGSGSWLGVLAFFEIAGGAQLARGVFFAAHFAIGLTEEMVRHRIVWIHGDSALQRADSELGLSLFLQNLAHQYIRSGGSCIQPDGTLKEALGVVEFLDARVGVGEFVVSGSVAGIEREFLLKFGNGFGNLRSEEIDFAEKIVSERQFGIDG